MSKKTKNKTIIATGKRKKSIARATIKEGKGRIRINKVDLNTVQPVTVQGRLMEPLILAGELAKKVDIDVNVNGGGITGQADASRTAISNALLAYSKQDDKLKNKFLEYDRSLLVSDMRQKESTKPNKAGSARSRTQKSYR